MEHLHLAVAPPETTAAARRPWDWARWLVVGLGLGGVALFVLSFFQNWWSIWLYAPQYPKGLRVDIALTGMGGDVHEVDLLNHYIGMPHLENAAPMERHYAAWGVAFVCVLTVALVLASGKRLNKIVAIPAFTFPLLFLGDSVYWLYEFGHHLDPHAPLRMKAFTPQMFGNGKIGQFETYAQPAPGFWLAVAGVLLVVAAVVVRWQVCKHCARGGTCGATCPRLLVLPGAALLMLMALTGCSAAPRAAEPAVHAGPEARALPTGAAVAVARSFDELAALVADPAGPSEIALVRGVMRGNLVVKRPLALRGEGGAVLEGSGAGTVLTIEADDVTVENLVVRHSGRRNTTEDAGIKAKGERVRIAEVRVDDALFGVSLAECHHCALERVSVEGFGDDAEMRGDGIKLWESDDTVVKDCVVDHVRDVVVWYTRRALLEGNVVRRSRYGTHFMYAHDSIARKSRLEKNVVGVFVMYSRGVTVEGNVLAGAHGAAGMGIGFKESDAAIVRGNWLVADTTGAYLDTTPRSPGATVTFEGNVFALDDAALRLHGVEKGLVFAGNELRENAKALEVDGGGDALGVDVHGNHFSDYAGYDLDGDGTGDVPYRVSALSREMEDDRPALRFFDGTPAMQVIDAVARAVPLVGGRTILEDKAPRMRAPEVSLP
jgi:nitrous oxidase accessory protein